MNTKIKILNFRIKCIAVCLKVVSFFISNLTKLRTRLYQEKSLLRVKTMPVINWSYENTLSTGFIAQTVASVAPAAVAVTPPSGPWHIQPKVTTWQSNCISIKGESKEILTITNKGDVIWHGKPSEASSILVRNFTFKVEDQIGITKAARRRYYYLACRSLLKKAQKMDGKEFIDHLEKEVYNREGKVMWDALSNEHKN